jgi:hypothetical protein
MIWSKKKPRHLRGFFILLRSYFFFFAAAFFLGAFFFAAIWIHLQFSFLYDYCSPLTGKLSVRNIFKLCHIKVQNKNHEFEMIFQMDG